MEKVRPVDEPDENSVFMPFETFEEECKNDIKYENNVSDKVFPQQKSTIGNEEEIKSEDALVHENDITSTTREGNYPLIKDNCGRSIRDIHTNAGGVVNDICNTNATKALFDDCTNIVPVMELDLERNFKKTSVKEGSQFGHSMPDSERGWKENIDKNECIDRDSKIEVCLQSRDHKTAVGMEMKKNSQCKRKQLDNEKNENELAESVDEESIGRVSKRRKKDQPLDSISTASRGRR